MNIDFPFRVDGHGRTAGTDYDAHIRELIEQVLLTAPGERVNRPDFGSGLLQMVFQANSPEIAGALQFSLQAALQQWLGSLIQVEGLQVESSDSKLQVSVQYVVLADQQRRSAQFTRGV